MNQADDINIKNVANHLMGIFCSKRKFRKQQKKNPEFYFHMYQYFIHFIIRNDDLNESELIDFLLNTKKQLLYNVLHSIQIEEEIMNNIARDFFEQNI